MRPGQVVELDVADVVQHRDRVGDGVGIECRCAGVDFVAEAFEGPAGGLDGRTTARSVAGPGNGEPVATRMRCGAGGCRIASRNGCGGSGAE
jgi:hypothetical protein